MANVFDYIDWRGDLRFTDVPLNEVDSLILSLISYVDFDGIVPNDPTGESVPLLEAIRQYLRRHRGETPYLGKLLPPEVVSITAKAGRSRRFGNARLSGYVNRVHRGKQIQFSALTFTLNDGTRYVAFRGTDDTLVGWKENFNMSFMQPVPAQLVAVRYLQQAMTGSEAQFYVGGHSKGGNLAVYAAVKCEDGLKDRIVRVFNNDGPGFSREFINGVDYRSMRGKIRTIIPHSSVVGMLLEHEETYEVVKSNATGILQHNGFTWEVLGGSFIHLDTVSEESRLIDSALKEWLNDMTVAEREKFVESLFETISAVGAKTLTDLTTDKVKLVRAWSGLDPKARSVLLKCITLLLRQKRTKK